MRIDKSAKPITATIHPDFTMPAPSSPEVSCVYVDCILNVHVIQAENTITEKG
jgi:hypothetical protein